MILKQLNQIPTSRDICAVWKGYNHNLSIDEGEFYDMQNMTSDFYPLLSPRGKRGYFATSSNLEGVTMCGGDDGTLFYCTISKLFKAVVSNGTITHTELASLEVDTGLSRKIFRAGNYIVVMPDKLLVNIANGAITHMEADYTWQGVSDVVFVPCNENGIQISYSYTSATDPSKTTTISNGALWRDTSVTPNVVKQYSTAQQTWVEIKTYTRIKLPRLNSDPHITSLFKDGDYVTIYGINPDFTELASLNEQKVELKKVYTDNTIDYAVIENICYEQHDQSGETYSFSLQRNMPALDFVFECNNRLWGCCYYEVGGTTPTVINEIYASKLGDFTNWNVFQGISTDSYVASVGTAGKFTGAINYNGYPMFFKENCIHKVYGDYPSNYQVQTTTCDGVALGAADSLAVVNGYLFYKSPKGVCIYSGTMPSEIGEPLGRVGYNGYDSTEGSTHYYFYGARGIGYDSKYYMSAKNESTNTWNLFVYDLEKGLWHREDNTKVRAFAVALGDLCFFYGGTDYTYGDTKIRTIDGTGTKDADSVEWMAETGILGTKTRNSNSTSYYPEKKYIDQIVLRLQLDVASQATFYIEYDSSGVWEELGTICGNKLKTFDLPIRPKRCDHFRLKFKGTGECKVFSMTRVFERGAL